MNRLFLAQRGVSEMSIPPSIHLTITPIHEKVVDKMLRDLMGYFYLD